MDVAVNVAVSDGVDFKATLEEARGAGLQVSQALDGLGVISGQIAQERMPQLARIPGVSVEVDREVGTASQ